MPAEEQMTSSEKYILSLTDNDTNMTDDEQRPANKQNSSKQPFYNTPEEWLAYPNFRKDVKEFNATPFYRRGSSQYVHFTLINWYDKRIIPTF